MPSKRIPHNSSGNEPIQSEASTANAPDMETTDVVADRDRSRRKAGTHQSSFERPFGDVIVRTKGANNDRSSAATTTTTTLAKNDGRNEEEPTMYASEGGSDDDDHNRPVAQRGTSTATTTVAVKIPAANNNNSTSLSAVPPIRLPTTTTGTSSNNHYHNAHRGQDVHHADDGSGSSYDDDDGDGSGSSDYNDEEDEYCDDEEEIDYDDDSSSDDEESRRRRSCSSSRRGSGAVAATPATTTTSKSSGKSSLSSTTANFASHTAKRFLSTMKSFRNTLEKVDWLELVVGDNHNGNNNNANKKGSSRKKGDLDATDRDALLDSTTKRSGAGGRYNSQRHVMQEQFNNVIADALNVDRGDLRGRVLTLPLTARGGAGAAGNSLSADPLLFSTSGRGNHSSSTTTHHTRTRSGRAALHSVAAGDDNDDEDSPITNSSSRRASKSNANNSRRGSRSNRHQRESGSNAAGSPLVMMSPRGFGSLRRAATSQANLRRSRNAAGIDNGTETNANNHQKREGFGFLKKPTTTDNNGDGKKSTTTFNKNTVINIPPEKDGDGDAGSIARQGDGANADDDDGSKSRTKSASDEGSKSRTKRGILIDLGDTNGDMKLEKSVRFHKKHHHKGSGASSASSSSSSSDTDPAAGATTNTLNLSSSGGAHDDGGARDDNSPNPRRTPSSTSQRSNSGRRRSSKTKLSKGRRASTVTATTDGGGGSRLSSPTDAANNNTNNANNAAATASLQQPTALAAAVKKVKHTTTVNGIATMRVTMISPVQVWVRREVECEVDGDDVDGSLSGSRSGGGGKQHHWKGSSNSRTYSANNRTKTGANSPGSDSGVEMSPIRSRRSNSRRHNNAPDADDNDADDDRDEIEPAVINVDKTATTRTILEQQFIPVTTKFNLYVKQSEYHRFFKRHMKEHLDSLSRYNKFVVSFLVIALIGVACGTATSDWSGYVATPRIGSGLVEQRMIFGIFSTCFLGRCEIATSKVPFEPTSVFFSAVYSYLQSLTPPVDSVCVMSTHDWTVRSGAIRVLGFAYFGALCVACLLSLIINNRPTRVRTQLMVAGFTLLGTLGCYLPAILIYQDTYMGNSMALFCGHNPCEYANMDTTGVIEKCRQVIGWGFWCFAFSSIGSFLAALASIFMTLRIYYLRRNILASEGINCFTQYLHKIALLQATTNIHGISVETRIGRQFVEAMAESVAKAKRQAAIEAGMDVPDEEVEEAERVGGEGVEAAGKSNEATVATTGPTKNNDHSPDGPVDDVPVFKGVDLTSPQILNPSTPFRAHPDAIADGDAAGVADGSTDGGEKSRNNKVGKTTTARLKALLHRKRKRRLVVTADIFDNNAAIIEANEDPNWIYDGPSQLFFSAKWNCFWDPYSGQYYSLERNRWLTAWELEDFGGMV